MNKILVVYFSRSGHTKSAAETLAEALNADIEPIYPAADYSGWRGYMRAGYQAWMERPPLLMPFPRDLSSYDLVVVGGPVWNASLCSPVRSFLTFYGGEIRDAAFFLTQGGQLGRGRVFHQMKRAYGKEAVASLALSDKEITDGSFRGRIEEFAAELAGEKAGPAPKRAKTKVTAAKPVQAT